LANKPNLQLQDDDQDGIYELTVPISKYQQAEESEVRQTWTLTQDISRYPQYKSEQVLCDALYNLSLEELLQDVRKDGALMAVLSGRVSGRAISVTVFFSRWRLSNRMPPSTVLCKR
jgi:hypothetical protein